MKYEIMRLNTSVKCYLLSTKFTCLSYFMRLRNIMRNISVKLTIDVEGLQNKVKQNIKKAPIF